MEPNKYLPIEQLEGGHDDGDDDDDDDDDKLMCQSIWYLKKFWFRGEVLAEERPFIFIGSPESRQYPSLYLTTSSISLPNWRPPNPPVDNKQQHKSLPNTDWIWKRWQIGLKWFLQSLKWGVMQNSPKIENQIILFCLFFPPFTDDPTWLHFHPAEAQLCVNSVKRLLQLTEKNEGKLFILNSRGSFE